MADLDVPFSYVFVREDLSEAQRIIQVSHATRNEALDHCDDNRTETHTCLLAVHDELELIGVSRYLRASKVRFYMFYEPDGDAGFTALVTEPIEGDERRAIFKGFRMFGDPTSYEGIEKDVLSRPR